MNGLQTALISGSVSNTISVNSGLCGIPNPHATMRNVTKYGPCNPVNIIAISNIILASLLRDR